MEEGKDYCFNEQGLLVFTSNYLLSRGFCCGNGCQNCPYDENGDLPEICETAENSKGK